MSLLGDGPFGKFDTLSLSVKGSIIRVTINNPPINILNHKLLSDLHAFLITLKASSHGIKVVIFASENPKFFVAHYDLHIFSANSPLAPPLTGEKVSTLYVEVVRMLWQIPVISIAEINGQAFGAGNELLVQMDMRFAGPNTKLGSLEVGLGVFAANGELQFMTKLMGRARALEYLLSSGTASAEEAERMGWVNRSFTTVEALQEHVTRLAERIGTFSASALAATKAGVNEQAPSEAALQNDLVRFRQLAAEPETQRAVSEFLKRSEDQSEGKWELGLNHNLVELWPKGST